MRGVLRSVLLVLILAFAAGTVLHTSRAAAMDLAMAVPSAAMPMPGDCGGCGDDGGQGDGPGSAMGSCAALCAVPPMAPPAADPQVVGVTPAAVEPPAGTPAPAGLASPPDPHPPRAIVLI